MVLRQPGPPPLLTKRFVITMALTALIVITSFLSGVAQANTRLPAEAALSCPSLFLKSVANPTEALKLVDRQDPVLRERAALVSPTEFGTPALAATVSRMIDIMESSSGVGIAAPQVGLSKQILIAQITQAKVTSFQDRRDITVMINPKITAIDSKKELGPEGCLSIGGQCGIVPRDKAVEVTFQDVDGLTQTLTLSGFSARIVQHEVDHLNGILFVDRAASFAELIGLKAPLPPEEKALIVDAKLIWAKSNPIEKLKWHEVVTRLAGDLSNPYSLIWDLRSESAKLGRSFNLEIRSLLKILAQEKSIEQSESLNHWIQSETHALFVYDLLNQRGLKQYSDTIAYLLKNNLYFSDGQPVRGPPVLLTYAFEKEGINPDISLLYKPPQISDEEWFKKTDRERFELLKGLKMKLKTFQSAANVAPTALKPSFLSGYSVELPGGPTKTGYGWEISHKRYEISRHRLMQEVRQIAALFKETHSFHVHTVFELPRLYRFFPQFRMWFKSLNDFLYLRGMEEGLHGNDLTDVLNLPEDVGDELTRTRAFRLTSVGEISRFKTKFLSAGLRGGGLYGKASSPLMNKVGIELRDSTRNLTQLDLTMEQLSATISGAKWEQLQTSRTPIPRLHTAQDKTIAALVQAGIPKDMAAYLYRTDRTVGLPLIAIETGESFNFSTGQLESADPTLVAEVQAARAVYVNELIALGTELRDFAAKHESVDPSDVEMVIRKSLTEWARAARPSRRFHF